MNSIYRIFISATKRTMEFERDSLINNLLISGCHPMTMEFFVSSNNSSTLRTCINAINDSDAVILLLKERYGEQISKEEIEKTFREGCPLKLSGKCICDDSSEQCKYSYTHFEYLYSKVAKKIVYVLSNLKGDEIKVLFEDAKNNGAYNIYTNESDFNAVSTRIISKIVEECKENPTLGLVSALYKSQAEKLEERVAFLENNYFNGYILLKNYMGCIIGNTKFVFYVYKELDLVEKKTGYDFSIHINTEKQASFTGSLSRDMIDAHAYVKCIGKDKRNGFHECTILEKSYGREYLNCHIDFKKNNGIRLNIDKGDKLGIFYTYQVEKKLYGDEIGRKTSPFFEEALVELIHSSNHIVELDCYEKVENTFIDMGDVDIEQRTSFLEYILTDMEIQEYITERYGIAEGINGLCIKQIKVPNVDKNKKGRMIHFYVKWSE